MAEEKVSRSFSTRRFLDRRLNPPAYVDEELPTKTTHIFSRNKQGTILSSASGITIMGSIQFAGSYHGFDPGSYSLRVIRRTIGIGSRSMKTGHDYVWKLRHSREGTIDAIPFYSRGTLVARQAYVAQREERVGGPLNPIYAFGPGTIWTYFHPYRGTARVFSSLEGLFSHDK